jgi:hypothetical protein
MKAGGRIADRHVKFSKTDGGTKRQMYRYAYRHSQKKNTLCQSRSAGMLAEKQTDVQKDECSTFCTCSICTCMYTYGTYRQTDTQADRTDKRRKTNRPKDR